MAKSKLSGKKSKKVSALKVTGRKSAGCGTRRRRRRK